MQNSTERANSDLVLLLADSNLARAATKHTLAGMLERCAHDTDPFLVVVLSAKVSRGSKLAYCNTRAGQPKAAMQPKAA